MERAFIIPVKVPEFFISGVALIDDLGDGNHRFWCFANQGGEKIIRYKVVCAAPTIYTNMQQTMMHMGYQCCGGQRSRVGMN